MGHKLIRHRFIIRRNLALQFAPARVRRFPKVSERWIVIQREQKWASFHLGRNLALQFAPAGPQSGGFPNVSERWIVIQREQKCKAIQVCAETMPLIPMWDDQTKVPFFHKAFPEIIRSAVATLVAMGTLCTLHARRSV